MLYEMAQFNNMVYFSRLWYTNVLQSHKTGMRIRITGDERFQYSLERKYGSAITKFRLRIR